MQVQQPEFLLYHFGCFRPSFSLRASISPNRESQLQNRSVVLLDLVSAVVTIDSIEGNTNKLGKKDTLHFRLFYVATSSELDDVIRLRCALISATCLKWRPPTSNQVLPKEGGRWNS